MNKLYYFITLTFISLVNGYCEDFCFNNTCEYLNGNYISECDECPIIYMCNTAMYSSVNLTIENNKSNSIISLLSNLNIYF